MGEKDKDDKWEINGYFYICKTSFVFCSSYGTHIITVYYLFFSGPNSFSLVSSMYVWKYSHSLVSFCTVSLLFRSSWFLNKENDVLLCCKVLSWTVSLSCFTNNELFVWSSFFVPSFVFSSTVRSVSFLLDINLSL